MPHPLPEKSQAVRRPDPDALPARIQTEDERKSRAKLKIFFGFAPGVGKTFRMLLAHSNVPGARHTKRWQDVLELLHAGIDVFTTLNVQHVESLNDVVAQITNVQVRETVPDSILERADEIELVDLTADQLLQRLQDGKVYLHDQAARAAQHFFQRGNLLALRELALRQTADRVEADVQAQRTDQAIESPSRTNE